MDGNRRWAKKQGLAAAYGHRQGVEAVKRAVDFCLKKHIPYLSLYTFSIENHQRSAQEKNYLFELMISEATKGVEEFIANNVRVCFVGDRSLFPSHLIPLCEDVECKTAAGTALQFNILFYYGGRQEIVGSIKQIIRDVRAGLLTEDDVTEQLVNQHLWMGAVPEPDLIIRTGGFKRLSNFLLYQAAYSELYFLDCLWPEMTTDHLEQALSYFNTGKRNFGT
jgi:undecaprenyl diphosphate synthase